MSLHLFYRSLFVALFLSSYVSSAPVPTVQHDEASRGERDVIAVAAAADTGPECRVSADCVSDPLRPICDEARCVGCQNDAQCAAERPGMTRCALIDEPGAETGQCLPCSPYAKCSTDPIQWYVDPVDGKDENPGTRVKPFRTLAKAMPLVRPGHTLNLRGNAFYPPTSFQTSFSGTRERPITVQAYIEPYAVFDGGYPELREAPNDAWEQVPGGHPEEWRTKTVYEPRDPAQNPEGIYWGEIMGRKVRLLAYTALEDLRAVNESRAIVPLSDPRPAGGPLVRQETKKIPWCYYGPGLTWVPLNPSDRADPRGHIHVRLSHTHVNAPGFGDYAGETNPNKLALSIAEQTPRLSTISSNHVIFKNLVFQNGGLETVKINGKSSPPAAHNLVFDHVQFIGGRHVVRMANTTGVRFLHSTFDGGLAPWTGRHETKASYRYYKTYRGRGHPDNVRRSNGLARQTNTILLITGGGTDLEIAYSTFRRAHDAISVSGLNTQIHHSLFEDINDEALQFAGIEPGTGTGGTDNVRVYQNMLRQTLNPLSFALRRAGGRVYIYRNVIDMRVPTRGDHALPPDAPEPWLWRYGLDFKINGEIHPFFVYHNTFITSHNSNQTTSAVFSGMRKKERWYYNNVHVMMNVGEPMMWIPNPELPARASGNVYYNYTPGYEGPYFRHGKYNGLAAGEIVDMAALYAHDIFQKFREANGEGFEVGSQIADPGFANFTRQTFDHQVPYPNNDFRPSAGSPLIGPGRVLPESWPDPYRPSDGTRPDVGAMPFGAPPMAVGVDAATQFPAAGVPLAIAGNRQVVVDDNGDGFASVLVDAGASHDLDGAIVDYEWRVDGRLLSQQVSDTLYLPAKRNVIELRVRDNEGHEDTDAIEVVITPPVRHSENLLDSPGFEPSWLGTSQWQFTAGGLITASNPHTGAFALELTGAAAARLVEQIVDVVPGTTYEVSAWIQTAATLGAQLQYRVRSATGADLETTTVATVTGTNAYAHYRQRFVTPANAATLTVMLGLPAGDSGRAFFDDVRLISNNLLVDASFELRAKDGTRSPGWVFVQGGAFAEAADAHSGRSALALIGGADYRRISSQPVPVTAGKSYAVSGWVKTARPTKASFVKIRFVDADGRDVSRRKLKPIPPNRTTPYGRVGPETFVAPATAKAMHVVLHLDGPATGEAPTTGSVFYDDMMVEEVEEQ
jgi:hypothetical protein